MNDPTGQPVKPRFYDICLMYDFDDQALQNIADIV
jgi:hypothetical protein